MKPNFALSLSFDGIALLHRSGRAGWYLVGEVSLDADDLAGDLAELRSKAVALEPSGLATKLIIPDEQIRYMDVPAPGDAAHDRAAREALEGATPYHIDDLSYDWSLSDGRLYIAAVASETLDEAESFAVEHRFNPVSFVARPETDAFAGEPFFGLAAQARDVERDTVPVEILGRAHMPDPAVVVPVPSGDRHADTDPVVPPTAAQPRPDPEPAPDPAPEDPTPVPTFSSRRVGQADPVIEARPVASEETGGPPGASDSGPADPGPVDVAAPRALPALSTMAAASLAPLAADKTIGAAEDVSAPAVRPQPAPPGAAPAVTVGSAARAATAMSPEAEAQRLTIFGARREPQVGGKPRFLGLILTAILLFFLIGVAAFATIFSDDGFSDLFRSPEPEVAETPTLDPLPDPAPTETIVQQPETTTQPEAAAPPRVAPDVSRAGPEIGSEEAAETPDEGGEGIEGTVSSDETAAQEPLDAPPQVTPAEPPQLSEERRLSRYAATGIWHKPPDPPAVPDSGGLDDVYQTSIDMAVDIRDAVALPAQPEARSDRRPPTPPDPVSAGTTFSLDQRGLVAATPEGALTPEGVTVRSGPPPARPPEVPPRAVPLADQSLDAETAAEVMRLGGIRPRSRPTDLIEQQERGALSGRSRSELAALRPRPRPQQPQQPQQPQRATAEADPDTRAASLAGPLLRAPSEAETEDEVDALPQAVASSAKPRQRPAAVEQAAEETVAAPVQSTTEPRIPSRASVARQATERNAINLRNVNLIGVYGTRQERRALVRLSNGRYQKVKVGDRLDGGRVSAIGDSELRYNKRGRNVVLRLPKG